MEPITFTIKPLTDTIVLQIHTQSKEFTEWIENHPYEYIEENVIQRPFRFYLEPLYINIYSKDGPGFQEPSNGISLCIRGYDKSMDCDIITWNAGALPTEDFAKKITSAIREAVDSFKTLFKTHALAPAPETGKLQTHIFNHTWEDIENLKCFGLSFGSVIVDKKRDILFRVLSYNKGDDKMSVQGQDNFSIVDCIPNFTNQWDCKDFVKQ